MLIIQLSDMHLSRETDRPAAFQRVEKALDVIKPLLAKGQELLICCCGDVIDRGDTVGYELAELLWKRMRDCLSEYLPRFEFVPGNHDLVGGTLSAFDAFVSRVTGSPSDWASTATRQVPKDDLSLLLMNTVNRSINHGSVDLTSASQWRATASTPTLAVAHHTMLSRYHDDTSAIRNAYELVAFLSDSPTVGFLHGHTHGYSDITVGRGCRVIGVGPFLKDVTGVATQFNLIKVSTQGIESITNFRAQSDLNNSFHPYVVFEREPTAIFTGAHLKETHEEVIAAARTRRVLANLQLVLSTDFDAWTAELSNHYSNSLELAQKWLAPTVPESLHYNHGSRIAVGDKSMLDHVRDELKTKATSSRALFSLIDNPTIRDSHDGFLPSLNLVQAGFNDERREELLLTAYLRALEVGKFLPINVCELYLIASELKHTFRSIRRLTVTLNAFRAQYIENFGCLHKTRLDCISESELTILLSEGQYEELAQLLSEKRNLAETVVVTGGVETLLKALHAVTQQKPKWATDKLAQFDMLKHQVVDLHQTMNGLRALQRQTSLHDDREIRELQRSINRTMECIENLVNKELINA